MWPSSSGCFMLISWIRRNPHEYSCSNATEFSAWNVASWELFALRQKYKSTNCSLHTDRRATGLKPQPTLVHTNSFLSLLSGKLLQLLFIFLPLFLLISQFEFVFVFFWLKVHWISRVHSFFFQVHGSHLMLLAPRRTQCTGIMNTSSFSSYIKITAFSLPRSNNWKKGSWFVFPYGCKSHFYSTRYYVQTNSKSTFPVYFSIITIKSGVHFYDDWTLKYI